MVAELHEELLGSRVAVLWDAAAAQYLSELRALGRRRWKDSGYFLAAVSRSLTGRSLQSLRRSDFEAYRARRAGERRRTGQPLSPWQVNNELKVARALLNWAIARGWLRANPMAGVKALPIEERPPRALAPDQVQRLLEECSQNLAWMRPLITLAIMTGVRRGELLRIRWADVDLVKRKLQVAGPTKTGRFRIVELNELAVEALRSCGPAGPDLFVFAYRGKPRAAFRRSWSMLLRRAGLRVRFHDLRHTSASFLLNAGADLNVVREVLGHRNVQTTAIYARLFSASRQQAVERVSRMYGPFMARVQGELFGPASDPVARGEGKTGELPAVEEVLKSGHVTGRPGSRTGG